ncbi:MAG: universal stress protein [Bacteroidota bacterium]
MAFDFNNIFFPTDFSKNAKRALPIAAKIASLAGSRLILCHTVSGTLDRPDLAPDREKAINDARELFEQMIVELRQDDQYKDLEILVVLQSGPATTGLLEQAHKQGADLIVMGTKGATGNRKLLFGSVASSIILKSEIPVLAVPPGSSFDDFKHIAFTTDYHDGDLEALQQVIELAKLFDSSIDIIHVADQQNLLTDVEFRGFKDLVRDKTGYDKISFDIIYEYDFYPAMSEYCMDHPHSLLVMVRYKKTYWEKLVKKDHSKEMACYTKVPLLVLVGGKKTKKEIRTEGEGATSFSKEGH